MIAKSINVTLPKFVNLIVSEEIPSEDITSFEEIAQKLELMGYEVFMELESGDSTQPRPKRPK